MDATPEQIQRMRIALPDVNDEELLADLLFYESYVKKIEDSISARKRAVVDSAAYKMAAGFNRPSWKSLCKVGPPPRNCWRSRL